MSHVYVHEAKGLQNQDKTGGQKTSHKPDFNRTDHCDPRDVRRVGLMRTCFVAGADPYVIISCEGRSVRSTIRKDTLEPEFATSGIFYRKKPRKPITVEVR